MELKAIVGIRSKTIKDEPDVTRITLLQGAQCRNCPAERPNQHPITLLSAGHMGARIPYLNCECIFLQAFNALQTKLLKEPTSTRPQNELDSNGGEAAGQHRTTTDPRTAVWLPTRLLDYQSC